MREAVLINPRNLTWLAINDRKRRFGGGYTDVVPPVPIPNTEVKYVKADDSQFSGESR